MEGLLTRVMVNHSDFVSSRGPFLGYNLRVNGICSRNTVTSQKFGMKVYQQFQTHLLLPTQIH